MQPFPLMMIVATIMNYKPLFLRLNCSTQTYRRDSWLGGRNSTFCLIKAHVRTHTHTHIQSILEVTQLPRTYTQLMIVSNSLCLYIIKARDLFTNGDWRHTEMLRTGKTKLCKRENIYGKNVTTYRTKQCSNFKHRWGFIQLTGQRNYTRKFRLNKSYWMR